MKPSAQNDDALGRLLSYLLRHHPEDAGIQLDSHGWADVDALIHGVSTMGRYLSRADLERIVRENKKRRYSFSPDGKRIRANQGHSIPVDLELLPEIPPDPLYHGTASRFWESIQKQGLLKQSRQSVHLSSDRKTALDVGIRHGIPIILRIHTGKMLKDGFSFYLSENGVWLCESVPAVYLEKEKDF